MSFFTGGSFLSTSGGSMRKSKWWFSTKRTTLHGRRTMVLNYLYLTNQDKYNKLLEVVQVVEVQQLILISIQ
jgi:hypothetical protein